MSLPELTIDRLRRIQATLTRRVGERDPHNITAVGFAPLDQEKASRLNEASAFPVTAQFDVQQKRDKIAAKKRIQPLESVRLLDRDAGKYDSFSLTTNVIECGEIVPSGVRIRTDHRQATTSVVVRWTTVDPVPPNPPGGELAEDPRWRWGVVTVSHLFALGEGTTTATAARVRRARDCGAGPTTIRGTVRARGRIPGGPDVALVETGLDRLWLSGFLTRPDAAALSHVTPAELVRFTSRGTSGDLLADGESFRWRWLTFYPDLQISGLGHLQHIVRYEIETTESVDAASVSNQPLRPGSSGSLLIAGGIPIGMSVASTRPNFRIGYAQTFDVSLDWLARRLAATNFSIVNVIGDEG